MASALGGRRFRLVALDWDGTAVESRKADATRVTGLFDRLLAAGARVCVVTGTSLANVLAQLGDGIAPENARRLFVCASRGSEAFGFDRRRRPVELYRRVATERELALLDRVADEVRARLVERTRLTFEIVRDRLNRRKVDLIPEPAWRDPPKSALGDLLAATEARLRGAGLSGGLHEAFAMAESVARELGLVDARITSDVKHLEVGLTDKADAARFVFERVAAPVGIEAADVLLLGDELGPIAGFEGSDHRMLAAPEAAGATVISVGPEPAGVPPPVIHLGGGPARFCELIEALLAREAIADRFAAPLDASFVVSESAPIPRPEVDSLFATANGYLGLRSALGSLATSPIAFLAGAYAPSLDHGVPEIVATPGIGRVRVLIDGEPVALVSTELEGEGRAVRRKRSLDLRRGVALASLHGRMPGGAIVEVRALSCASLADRRIVLEAVEVTSDHEGSALMARATLGELAIDQPGASHWVAREASAEGSGVALHARTAEGLELSVASRLTAAKAAGGALLRHSASAGHADEEAVLPLSAGVPREVRRVVALASSRDTDGPARLACACCASAAAEPFGDLLAAHEAAWKTRWADAEVTIDGAPEIDRALRFAVHHLLAAPNPADPRCSLGPRLLSGEAYRGHVFWDTEVFLLPFYAHAWPEAARALLAYRHRTLPGARRKAEAHGYAGALYAWESADTGDEVTPSTIVTAFGDVLRVLSGEQEQHISADVAYAFGLYERVTGDPEIMRAFGLEVLVETARFWASRARVEADGRAHIRHVIGPDEYHEGVDDDAFTNWMARDNLREAARRARAGSAEDRTRLGVAPGEPEVWERVASSLATGQPEPSAVIEQFEGFFGLEQVDLASLGARSAPVDMILGQARTQRAQILKQADVVQILALLWDQVDPRARRRSFEYYEPRTAHGSSLSPGIHALVAARLGLSEVAARLLHETAAIDLADSMQNLGGGVHAAAMGSLWQAVVLGVGGVRPAPGEPEALLLEPRLLPGWTGLSFPLLWRGRRLEVVILPDALELSIEGPAPLLVRASPSAAATPAGLVDLIAEPGRRYVAPRRAEGFGAWEASAA